MSFNITTASGRDERIPCIAAVTVWVIPPKGHREQKRVFKAPDGKLFAASGIERTLQGVRDFLANVYPEWTFKEEQTDEAEFRFVYAGESH